MLSAAIMLSFSVLFPPPQKPKQAAAPAAAQQEGAAAADGEAANAEAEVDAQTGPAEQPPGAAPANPLPPVAAAAVPTQFFTLGSLDPESGYRMLVTVTTEGASVRRAEMSSPRYRDQHDRSGYLGELELTPVNGGVQVQAVGAGTPAAAAGIAVGDVIVGVGDPQATEVRKVDDLRAALAKTEPGQKFTLQIRRGDGGREAIVVEKLIWRPFAVVRPEIDNFHMRNAEPPADFDRSASRTS